MRWDLLFFSVIPSFVGAEKWNGLSPSHSGWYEVPVGEFSSPTVAERNAEIMKLRADLLLALPGGNLLFFFSPWACGYNRRRCPAPLPTSRRLLLIIKSHYFLILWLHFFFFNLFLMQRGEMRLKSERDANNRRPLCRYFTCVCVLMPNLRGWHLCFCLFDLFICLFPSTFCKSANPEEPLIYCHFAQS